MPVIYYAYYSPVSERISDISTQEHLLGRRLLSQGLRELYHISVSASQVDAMLRTEENGKPCLSDHPDIFFNITHCRGLAACAFGRSPLGIDAELPGYFPEILVARALSETEKSFLQEAGSTMALRQEWFYRLWTLKEAYVKKSGCGVDTDLTEFSFFFDRSNLPLRITCTDPHVSCFQEKLSGGQILSLCSLNTEKEVTLIDRSS